MDATPHDREAGRAISRRRLLGAALLAPMINLGRHRPARAQDGAPDTEYSTRCIDLVGGSLVVDMLSPLTIDDEVQERWGPGFEGFSEADREEFASSGIDVFHIAVGVGGGDSHQAWDNVLLFLSAHNNAIANRPDLLFRVDTAEELEAASQDSRIGVLLGVQDSEHFRTPADVELFWSLGQRVSQLTYNRRNRIGNGSTERVDGGISDFGVAVIDEMNRVGMAVDVSHSGDRTTLDACELSSRPVLFTHSNCRALAPGHPRCKTDEAIRAMAATGGVMGITGVRMFVKVDEPTTIEHLLDHFDHVRDLVGVEHLGIGSDVDLHGYDDLPAEQNQMLRAAYKGTYGFRDKIDIEGVDHPRRVFDLTEGLIRRGYRDDHIRGILGANFARALRTIWSGAPDQKE
jgi:membrane dipeptidase